MESRQDQFTIVPVLVGALKEGKEVAYGRVFSQYLADPHNLFVVSSDFCHWGEPRLPLPPSLLYRWFVGLKVYSCLSSHR